MIWIKHYTDIYNNNNLDKLIKDYPHYCSRFLAIHRIIFNTLRNELKEYPDIDIILSYKRQKSYLGRFCLDSNKHREYRFIKGNNPYIVLFIDTILKEFREHKVKGLKEVFLHEFYHFRQWLLNERLRHNEIIKSIDNHKEVEIRLKRITEALNKRA